MGKIFVVLLENHSCPNYDNRYRRENVFEIPVCEDSDPEHIPLHSIQGQGRNDTNLDSNVRK